MIKFTYNIGRDNMKKKRYIIIILLLILIALILLFISKNTYKDYSRNYFYMDTYINIKITTTKNKKEANAILDDIDYLYSTYHKLTSRYDYYEGITNVYYLNEKLEDNKEIEIDKRLADIISLGIEYYSKTNGLLNIAAGNLTGIWKNFLDDCETIPNSEELQVNINIDDINLKDNKYIKTNGIKLDLGSIAKGYTTELAGDYLESVGVSSYIINAGGNVKVGKNHNKKSYTVGITDPDNTNDIFTKVNINNLSVVTSGNYQRYCIKDDINYNHIIDPNTKMPSIYNKSVTVISNNSTIADIYSTYLYLLPYEEGLDIVNNTDNIEAIWYVDKDNIIKSDGFNYE